MAILITETITLQLHCFGVILLVLDFLGQHWSGLKSTSIDLLRNEFLKREGKLDIQDNNPRIFIEKKTQDILLEKIPWNISVTKIPWIEKLIYTDW